MMLLLLQVVAFLSSSNGFFRYYVDIGAGDLVVEEILNAQVRDCCTVFCNCYSKLISLTRKDARQLIE